MKTVVTGITEPCVAVFTEDVCEVNLLTYFTLAQLIVRYLRNGIPVVILKARVFVKKCLTSFALKGFTLLAGKESLSWT